MSHDQNGHTNGNGREKPFILAQPKSPEELAREAIRKQMPEFRRHVSALKILAQAKWLFCALSDDSFMFDFGGDGFGTVITTIKDLAARYRHDRDSISKWLALLERKEVIWIEWEHPFCVVHISAAVPMPKHKATMIQKMRARAGAARFSRAEGVGGPFFSAQAGQPASKTEENRIIRGNVPATRAEGVGTTCPQLPHDVRKLSVESDRQLPHIPPVLPARSAGTSPHVVPTSSARHAGNSRIEPAKTSTMTGQNASLESTPKNGGLETLKGEAPPPKIPKFEKLDAGMWPKDRVKVGPTMIEAIKEKIYAVENSRTPVKNAREIASAYRARIKEIKAWMTQEVAV